MSSLHLFVGIVFGVVCSMVARSRGRSVVGWFLAGLVVGPFGLVVALLPAQAREGTLVQCAACYEVIQADATICRFCRTELSPH